jgi:chromosome segregation ATPase
MVTTDDAEVVRPGELERIRQHNRNRTDDPKHRRCPQDERDITTLLAALTRLQERATQAQRQWSNTEEERADAEARADRLEAERDNAGFIPWAGAQDLIDELTARAERAEQERDAQAELIEGLRHNADRAEEELAEAEDRVKKLEAAATYLLDNLPKTNPPGVYWVGELDLRAALIGESAEPQEGP